MSSNLHTPLRGPRKAAALVARVALLGGVTGLASCGAKIEERIGRVTPNPSPSQSPIHHPEAGPGPGPGPTPTDASTSTTTDAKPACGESRAISTVEPALALYIMVDRSQYMLRDNKWSGAISSGLNAFLTSSEARSLELGLAYYPVDNGTTSTCNCTMPRCTNCRDARVNCAAADSGPDVVIVPRSQHDLLTTSIARHAIQAGAAALAPAWIASETYLESWQRANPNKRAVRVVIAGGDPWTDGCGDERLTDAVDAAAASPFRTYVIALDDRDRDAWALDTLASSGSGTRSIQVDPERGDVQEELVEALQEVVAHERGCNFVVPDGTLGRLEQVEMQLTFPADSGTASGPWTVNRTQDRQSCAGPHRWFPNPLVPGHMSLCRNACDQFHEFSGQLKLFTRCDTVTPQ